MRIPSYSSSDFYSEEILNVSLIGNINLRRYKWNPFDEELEMKKCSDNEWRKLIFLQGKKAPHYSGNYSLRVVINHNPKKQLKSNHNLDNTWDLIFSEYGEIGENINFNLKSDQLVEFIFNKKKMTIECRTLKNKNTLTPVNEFKSFQLNGFVWDDLNMFEKFNPRIGDRSFIQQSNELWTIDVLLKKNGGIDFRSDGVYQFLISSDFEEDYGFSSLNDGKGTLISSCGFSSSHGTSMNSGCTIRVQETGMYRFSLHSPNKKPKISVNKIQRDSKPNKNNQLNLLNNISSLQLLGTIYDDDQFNPQNKERNMDKISSNQYEKIVHVKGGEHSINFALSSELFLDTMGLGCWLDLNNKVSNEISGISWHGKPQEFNINFITSKDSDLKIRYNLETDKFDIKALSEDTILSPLLTLNTLSIVGNFEKPYESWSTQADINSMNSIGSGRFEHFIKLKKDIKYEYKYVANKSNWNLVFADYELDGLGTDFKGDNKNSSSPTYISLKKDGQLTTHGNPPPLQFVPSKTGYYRFYADIIIGSYSVRQVE